MPVSDARLAAGLHGAFGRPVAVGARRPWPRRSSLPMEELLIDGEWVLFKNLSRGPRPRRPGFMIDPLREIAVYREVLQPGGIDAPALRGAHADRGGRLAWLFLERVDGVPLDETGDTAAWERAAGWLADLHARPLPPAGAARLLRYDAAWLRRWVVRALRAERTLEPFAAVAARAVERVAATPWGLVHGEFYPANVLVADGRIRPVDWETAGIGPGLLDIAALTSGRWAPEQRERLERAYREALPVDGRPTADAFAGLLREARLLVALQWLGWESGFRPPDEHAHDWLGEAKRLAAELA